MIRTYKAGSRAAASETPAAKGLRSALSRHGKANAIAAPAAIAPATPKAVIKPRLAWSPEIAASSEAKRATARALAVMSSEHFAGREKLAAELLGNPKVSADEIISILRLAGSRSQAEQSSALEDMRAALAQAARHNGTSEASGGSAPSNAAGLWARAHAKVAAELGR